MDAEMSGRTLFDRLRIGSLEARNRFVRAATYEGAADAQGHVTTEVMRLYRDLARGIARPLICEPDLVATWERDPGYLPRCRSCGRCFPKPGTDCILNA